MERITREEAKIEVLEYSNIFRDMNWQVQEHLTEAVDIRIDEIFDYTESIEQLIKVIDADNQRLMQENMECYEKLKELEAELEITNKLLEERKKVMDEIPECQAHGNNCVPHTIEWVRKQKQLEAERGDVVAEFGCHVDIFQGVEPDDCVIDTHDYHHCIYAKEGMKKEDCEYWKPITELKG